MGKRNQYNRSTLPVDMSVVLYQAAAAQSAPSTTTFTVNGDAGVLVYLPTAGTYTGSIDVSSMKNGQRLDIILPGNGFLLSCSAGSGKILTGGGFKNTSSLGGSTTYICYKMDFVDITTDSASNVLLLATSASYTGFA